MRCDKHVCHVYIICVTTEAIGVTCIFHNRSGVTQWVKSESAESKTNSVEAFDFYQFHIKIDVQMIKKQVKYSIPIFTESKKNRIVNLLTMYKVQFHVELVTEWRHNCNHLQRENPFEHPVVIEKLSQITSLVISKNKHNPVCHSRLYSGIL